MSMNVFLSLCVMFEYVWSEEADSTDHTRSITA